MHAKRGKLILITGGARSGKSAWAEKLAQEEKKVAYLATATAGDGEMAERIAQHQARRPSHWTTLEEPLAVAAALRIAGSRYDVILIDCLTLWLTNLLFNKWTGAESREIIDQLEKIILPEVHHLSGLAREVPAQVIIVTNEVGLGLIPENFLGRLFRDLAGRANQIMAAVADEVYLTVAGIPLLIKGRGADSGR